MQRWKRRAKCALALVVAAALAGSNADGLLLSAFAEENVQSAGGQSGGAAEEAENPSDIPVADPTGEAGQDEDGVVTGEGGVLPDESGLEEGREEDVTGSGVSESDKAEQADEKGEVPEEGTDTENPEVEESGGIISEDDSSGRDVEETEITDQLTTEPEVDPDVEAVKTLMAALLSLEAVREQGAEERAESFQQAQEVYAAYEALTEEQKAQIEGADGLFAQLFACYEEMEQSEQAEENMEEIDLSDWIFQEGGFGVWPDESMAVWSLEGEPGAQAETNLEGAKQAVLTAMRNWEPSVDISSYNVYKNDFGFFLADLINYNPELFYIKLGQDGCAYFYNETSGLISTIKLVYNEYTRDQVEEYKNALEKAYTEAITSESMTDVQKARALHDYLVQHMQYDTALVKRNAYNALVEGTAVCQGYSLAYAALLARAGIKFDYCSSDSMNHMWNYVLLDGQWYHVDVTWDDPVSDRVGYVRHRYFLCSDTQMASEGVDGHHDWATAQSCTSTVHDGAYWKDWEGTAPLSAIFYINGGEYYVRSQGDYGNKTISVICRNNNTETTVCTVPAVWKNSEGYWPGHYSALSYYNGKLYFNNQNTLYAVRPGSNEEMTVYEYQLSGGNSVYGSLVCGGKIVSEIAASPIAESRRETVDLPELPTGTITNKETGGYQPDYVYDRTSVPEPAADHFTTTNVGAAMTFEWYKNSVAAANRLGSAPMDAGTYILRVKAAMTDSYEAAMLDLNVTIAQKEITVTVTAQNKIYDGTADASVKASVAGVVSGDDVSITGLTGNFADKNVGNGKKVNLAGGKLTGAAAANYIVEMPSETTADIKARPVTVTADDKEKTYGDEDPAFTYTVSSETPLPSGETLEGKLEREEGEDVKENGYVIGQGTLTMAANPNYEITFRSGRFTIKPAEYTVTVKTPQSVFLGRGTFQQPVARLKNGSEVTGTYTYSYSGTDYTYENLVEALAKLPLGTKSSIQYSFAPVNGNYTGTGSGTFSFEVKEIEFMAGDESATEANAVTVKKDAVYGDSWADIVTIGSITAYAGAESDSDPAHFSLNVSGMPEAGDGRVFRVLYTGRLGGKDYNGEEVCSGTVNVAKRTITVTAGTYQVTKVYDKTVNPGTAAGELALGNILSQDAGKVTVTTAPVAYSSPNVGGQARMMLPLTLSGDAAGNYTLGSATVEVPCAITPKTIVPVLEVTGTYSYTGQAVIPEMTVSYTEGGATEALAVSDYEIILSDNINAGTAKVAVSPRAGGNYTWAGSVEGTFLISKVDYPYARTAELSARYGNDASFDLASLLPEGYVLGSVSVADSDAVLKGIPTVKGSVLSYTLSADRAKVGRSALVTVPVAESTNYNPFELVLTITMSDKLEQADFHFSQSVVDKVYGDSDFVAETVNAAEGSSLSFTSSNPNVAVVDNTGTVRIISAGSTVITAWASETDEYLRGTAVCTLQVARKALGWDAGGLYAVDREGTVSEQRKASLYGELKVNGILDADREAVTFNCPAGRLAGTYGAVTPGVQRVFLAWADPANPAVLQGAKASNYVLPSVLPECTGRINAVNGSLQPPAESTEKVQYNLSMETGISQVPPAFAGIESLNTPAKIESQMKLNIQRQAASVPEGNTVVYDVTLMVNINGAGWQAAGKDNFPADGLTITLPYPEGTSKDANDFIVCHLFTQDGNGHKAGEAEYPFVTKTDAGIRFKVTGLSPISVGWTKAGELNNAVEVGRNDSSASDDRQNAAVQSPKTSDENTILWYLVSMIVSGGLLAGMAFRRNRKNCR